MLKSIRKMQEGEKGFTLIELMIVVLIIAILLAIAIPTFLRIRRSAQDRAAQSSVTNALKSEESFYNEGAEVFTDNAQELERGESAINYDAAAGTDTCTAFANERCVAVTLVNPGEVVLTAESANGTFWTIRDVEVDATETNVGTWYGSGATQAASETAAAKGDVANASEW